MAKRIYDFEGPLDLETLPRPPLAALRALRITGVLLTPAGWRETPLDARQRLIHLGSENCVDREQVLEALMQSPPREMKMFPALREPAEAEVPEELSLALGPGRKLPRSVWLELRPLDRHVLMMLRANTRLLWRALDELMGMTRGGVALASSAAWTGELARCELRTHRVSARRINAADFHEGRACVLARVAGIRAARRTGQVLDLASQQVAGAIELGFLVQAEERPPRILCQAHVSTVDGQFFRSASLLGVATAATALYDMLSEHDPHLVIEGARVAEEPWMVLEEDETTVGR